MKIASVTLTSSRRDIIADAIRSAVDWVDMVVLIDLGIQDDTVEVVREIAGDKLTVTKWSGPTLTADTFFADVRNFGLEEAERLGADWACTLDTDERIITNGVDIREQLESMPPGVILVPHVTGSYCKERFFSMPLVEKFSGHVHECVQTSAGRQHYMGGVKFDELVKPPERMIPNLEALVDVLSKKAEDEPRNPRHWYYLGDSLAGLGRDMEALRAFDKCASLRGWDEESAWACFRMAIILQQSNRFSDAIDLCAVGLARHPGFSELAWLAGEMCLRLGQHDKAIYWARMSVANGNSNGEDHFIHPRIGFRYPFGRHEGPYETMARAYSALGMQEESDKALEIFNNLKG